MINLKFNFDATTIHVQRVSMIFVCYFTVKVILKFLQKKYAVYFKWQGTLRV
jgi:hypothetical protein